MIIETSCNRFYRVTDCASEDLAHVWSGIELKRVKGEWIEKTTRAGRKNFTYVRKAGSRLISDDDGKSFDSEGYHLSSPREWTPAQIAELRRREAASSNY